jgi:hypothetical protein
MKILNSIIEKVVLFIGKIHWAPSQEISTEDQEKIRALLKDNYYIILTHRNNHLSTYFTALADLFLMGKFSYWAHALMNLEDEVTSSKDFRLVKMGANLTGGRELIEATGSGTHTTPFEQVFDVHGVVLLKPKCMALEEWTGVLDVAKAQMGKPYDSLFNIADDSALSCVELVRVILQSRPNYAEEFKNFEAMIAKYKNLSPQMYYDCGDFSVVFEARV